MKYFISEEYGTAYFMESGHLAGAPLNVDNTFDTDSSFIVDPDNEEVTPKFYHQVQMALIGKVIL